MRILKIGFYTILFLGSAAFSYGQKLPNVQVKSLRAPIDIKIDGKTTEWGNQLAAYNNATEIYYTIANDDDNLYLVLHATDPDVLTKITNQGVVVIINSEGKKSDENAISITFPIFELQYNNKPYITFSNTFQTNKQLEAAAANPDSVIKVSNKKLHDNEKFIRTSGMAGIDTLLSVYNRKGIKVAEAFDNTMGYTYELAVPLKYLNVPTGAITKLVYHLILPGLDIDKDIGFITTKHSDGKQFISVPKGTVVPTKAHLAKVTSKTDFWGEYVLANK